MSHAISIPKMADEVAAWWAYRGITQRGGQPITGEDIFNYSPRGELFMVFEWHTSMQFDTEFIEAHPEFDQRDDVLPEHPQVGYMCILKPARFFECLESGVWTERLPTEVSQ